MILGTPLSPLLVVLPSIETAPKGVQNGLEVVKIFPFCGCESCPVCVCVCLELDFPLTPPLLHSASQPLPPHQLTFPTWTLSCYSSVIKPPSLLSGYKPGSVLPSSPDCSLNHVVSCFGSLDLCCILVFGDSNSVFSVIPSSLFPCCDSSGSQTPLCPAKPSAGIHQPVSSTPPILQTPLI